MVARARHQPHALNAPSARTTQVHVRDIAAVRHKGNASWLPYFTDHVLSQAATSAAGLCGVCVCRHVVSFSHLRPACAPASSLSMMAVKPALQLFRFDAQTQTAHLRSQLITHAHSHAAVNYARNTAYVHSNGAINVWLV